MEENDINVKLEKNKDYSEISMKSQSGWSMLGVFGLILAFCIGFIASGFISEIPALSVIGFLLILVVCIFPIGFKVLGPNEGLVLLLFGKYQGTLKTEGFHYVNPFCTSFNPGAKILANGLKLNGNKISLKAMTLDNTKQKVNDLEGNPIEIGFVVIWEIVDTAKATFNVDNYAKYIGIQSDATIRNIARQYPYDISDLDEETDEKSLRGSSKEISKMLCEELQSRVEVAGIRVLEARISHLAYAKEIAAVMLQRQQAKAIVDARVKIVEGAVGMVELAIDKLEKDQIVNFTDAEKGRMVSNLMMVLCANKDAQPIVDSSK
ncbi:MAG: SPFH domain-containing protein [Clostridia bacterium]